MPKSLDLQPPQVDEVSCITCNRLDVTGNFVQCDACDAWCHFSCAGVDASVSERVWVCAKCRAAPSISGKSGHSSKTGSSLARELERLKQQQESELKRANLLLQMKFLDQQQELLNKAATTDETKDRSSNIDQEANTQRMKDWVNHTIGDEEEGAVGGLSQQAASPTDQGNQQLHPERPDATKQVPAASLAIATSTDRMPTHTDVAELRAQLETCIRLWKKASMLTSRQNRSPHR